MIFSELYSAYYRTVAAIISACIDGKKSEKELQSIVTQHAFGESALTILPALKSGKWQLLHPDLTTPLTYKPTLPLTNLQKQWLKAISLDPRIQLFGVDFPDLDDVEPLFTPADYHVYDQYSDGDPYEDEGYIRRFRFLLCAIRNKTPIKVNITNKKGNNVYSRCIPVRMEYSEKDDKFRLITSGCRFMPTVNLSKITSCSRYNGEQTVGTSVRKPRYDTLTVRILDERNALERFMLHFSHFEKQAERVGKNQYIIRLRYQQNDETELLIRVLSFGPMVQVTEPPHFVAQMQERLKKQKELFHHFS